MTILSLPTRLGRTYRLGEHVLPSFVHNGAFYDLRWAKLAKKGRAVWTDYKLRGTR